MDYMKGGNLGGNMLKANRKLIYCGFKAVGDYKRT